MKTRGGATRPLGIADQNSVLTAFMPVELNARPTTIDMPGPAISAPGIKYCLDGQSIDLDPRHNYPRVRRILMATERDAADVAITTSFGSTNLVKFYVVSNEIDADRNKVPLPLHAAATLTRAPRRVR